VDEVPCKQMILFLVLSIETITGHQRFVSVEIKPKED